MVDIKKIRNQYYINAKELQDLTGFGINKCRELIKLARIKMEQDGCYIVRERPLEALTDYVLKMLGVLK